ncbi:Crp/Fnr family transcriptional regulator [bacterium]|nr:Crp/Fnr family transcriptional regulator [bacterium]
MLASKEQMAEFVGLFKTLGIKQIYRKGDQIIRPGDIPRGVYYIEKGLVKAYDITRYNEENLLIIRKGEEVFPLIWAMTGQERHVIYETLEETIVYRLDRKVFLKFIESSPEAMAPLLDMTIEMYRLHSERIINLEYRTARERIVSFLLTMSQRFGKKTAEGLLINVPLRHQDIASSVNATRETASREMAALARKGLIVNKQYQTIIKDAESLKKILD